MAVSVVIITGLSGSGMSSALKAFEDLGYFAVDNLPVQLIPTFVRLCDQSSEIERTAFVIDARSREFLGAFPRIRGELSRQGVRVTVVFLEADDDLLVRRYSETRRPHPLAEQDTLAAIQQERRLLSDIRDAADVIIDTSEHTVHTLRDAIKDRFGEKGSGHEMSVSIVSFGYRHGLPRAVDMLLDVRFLPNPHFVPELRPLTGRDKPVVEYLNASPEVHEALNRFTDLLSYLLPKFEREGKSYLTIGVGCTGGHHRSVMIAEALNDRLAGLGHKATVIHRDIAKDAAQYRS
jgi:UPF0042 nucleotide-binding protein